MCHPEVPAGQPVPDVATSEVTVPLPGGEQLPALLASPASGRGPAVLIVADIFGRSPFYEHLAARLAAAGFFALLPDMFFRQGQLPERTRDAAFSRFGQLDVAGAIGEYDAAVSWLRDRPGVTGASTGTIGFCLGGTLVLDLAARRDDLATVCYYGFPAGLGEPGERSAPRPLDVADQMHGPILGFWGDQDEAVGMDNVEALARVLDERGVEFEHTIYPGIGHGFLAASELDEASPLYEPARDSWARTLEFLQARLTT